MKRLTALVLVLALCLPTFMPLSALAATASGALTGPSSVKVGDTITLSFAVGGQGLLAVSGELSYDSNLVTLISVDRKIGDPWMLECNGNIFLVYDNNLTAPVNSNTVLFTATFQIKATAPADSVINISCVNVVASDGKQDVTIGTVKYSVKAHKYTSVVTKPTCTTQGYTTHTCSGCGTSYKDTYVNATGHKYSSVVTKPTCTAGGYTTHTCSVCKHSYVDSKVNATGHQMGAWTVVSGASPMQEQQTCANCTHKVTRTLSSITVTTKPTKLTYMEGESFSAAGMVITATFSDGTTRTVTGYTTSGYSSTPGTKTITVAYGGRTATFTVTVESKVPDKITSGTHTVVSGQTIGKIQAGTTVSALLNNIPQKQYVKVYDKNGKDVSGTAKVATGMTIKLMDGSTVKESLTVVVTGDVSGDGNISVTDMMAIKSHLLKKSTLSGAYVTAADTSGDGKLSITDFMQTKAHLLGKSTIQAR